MENQKTVMIIEHKIPRYNLRLLNFDFVLEETFSRFNNDIELYGVTNNFKKKDTQKLFINALIITICERMKKDKTALYINKNTLYLNNDERDTILNLSLKTIKKLPFQFILSDIPVDYFVNKIHNNVVESVILLETQLYYTINYDTLKYSFKGLVKFLKIYELSYLYDVYFKQLTNKLLVVK